MYEIGIDIPWRRRFRVRKYARTIRQIGRGDMPTTVRDLGSEFDSYYGYYRR